MARIVLGIGCSHTPQLHTPVAQWEIRAERDRQDGVPLWYHGERLTYAEVLQRRSTESFDYSSALSATRVRNSRAALDEIAAVFAECAPDVTLVFGNDQREIFLEDRRPAFTVMGAPEFVNQPRTTAQASRLPPGIALADHGHLPDDVLRVPGHPALATGIAERLCADGFDAWLATAQISPDEAVAQTSGMPHAYGFIYKQVMRDVVTPHVPIDINVVAEAVVPDAAACYAAGVAVGRAIRDWEDELRVCIIASGGLSHFVIDESFDGEILDAMVIGDFTRLTSFGEGYYQAGSAEIKSWIAAGGAMSGVGLDGRILSYEPLYRTEAGTGSAAAFAVWR